MEIIWNDHGGKRMKRKNEGNRSEISCETISRTLRCATKGEGRGKKGQNISGGKRAKYFLSGENFKCSCRCSSTYLMWRPDDPVSWYCKLKVHLIPPVPLTSQSGSTVPALVGDACDCVVDQTSVFKEYVTVYP